MMSQINKYDFANVEIEIIPGDSFPKMMSIDGAIFSCSSYKSGHHIQQLLSSNASTDNMSKCTFWQSESGTLPHTIYCKFPSIRMIREVRLLLDAAQDESYTPRCISIKVGSYVGDLVTLTDVNLKEPCQGWLTIDFKETVYTSCIAIVIVENVQNGRDSRLRGIQLG